MLPASPSACRIVEVQATPAGYVAEVEVRNDGSDTAAGVELEGVQGQINELANAKTKELGTLAAEKKKLAQAAAKIVGKYDGKIEKLQEKMRNIRAKADAALGIKPKKILTK